MIHVHDDATIALPGSGAFDRVRVPSLDMPCILGKAPHDVPASLDVEADVAPVAGFIADTIICPKRAEQVMRPDDA